MDVRRRTLQAFRQFQKTVTARKWRLGITKQRNKDKFYLNKKIF